MSVFRFKQFAVDQLGCAMKINTDGVLLGALSCGKRADHVLDIGTGTGVIALMTAQRYEEARVVGIESDASSATRALQNAAESVFSERIKIVHSTFQDYIPSRPVDLVVSNPPFYTNSLRNPDNRKSYARHTDMRFFTDLLLYAVRHLAVDGAMELILPPTLVHDVVAAAAQYGLHLCQRTNISSFANAEVIRQIIRLERQPHDNVEERSFVIYQSKGVYSEQYRELLKPFFLAF